MKAAKEVFVEKAPGSSSGKETHQQQQKTEVGSSHQTLEELMVEQGICREALRLAFVQHRQMAVGLKGVQKTRGIGDAFEQGTSGGTLVNLMKLDMLVGSEGGLSHAPRRVQ